jgi:ferredoxin--NADP+ reductase
LERTELRDGRVAGTGEFETIPADMVLRSVGYQSVPLPGLPFDQATMTVPNDAGRIRPESGEGGGQYVAGWLKRGPTGVIGTNKSDAAETVRGLLADLAGRGRDDRPRIDDLLGARGVTPVTYEEWLSIEAAESALAETLGRGERVKLVSRDAMLTACGRTPRPGMTV